MEEIGGYFGLECGAFTPYHRGVYLNSGSSAMKYIITQLGIKRIHAPNYTCRCIAREARAVGCEPVPYEVDARLMPVGSFDQDDYILYNNYFGVCGEKVRELTARYPKMIVDNAQAFYSHQIGLAGFYSPHKFFGVPDGGIATFRDDHYNNPAEFPPLDCSAHRVSCMLTRMDQNAAAGYSDYQAALTDLAKAPVLSMSKLTRALLGNVDYERVASIRQKNFRYLDERLHSSFPFALADDDVPLVYPYVTHDAGLRRKLIAAKIYVATYWPDMHGYDELRDTILPLPIDQRYTFDDMERILEVILA